MDGPSPMYKGLPEKTTDLHGEKLYGADFLHESESHDLYKELELLLSAEKCYFAWSSVTNICNIYDELRTRPFAVMSLSMDSEMRLAQCLRAKYPARRHSRHANGLQLSNTGTAKNHSS